jgi:effector-binding domain-containing protein
MERGPLIQQRASQPYVGILAQATSEEEFRAAVHRGFPELFGWLRENGIQPAGPPFIRYLEVAGDGQPLRFEFAAPTTAEVSPSGPVEAGALPAGRYATLLHVGPYTSAEVPDLGDARDELLDWARGQGIEWNGSETANGTEFEACVERYLNDAASEPDWSKWRTELAYLVSDAQQGVTPAGDPSRP